MGKHKGDTDSGGFEGLTAQEKADEFDASYDNPRHYAAENFKDTQHPNLHGDQSDQAARHQAMRDENDLDNRRK